jgi:hypothetical protein
MKVWFLLNTFALLCFLLLISFHFLFGDYFCLFDISFLLKKSVNLFSRLRKFEYVSYIFASGKHMCLFLQKRQRLSYLLYLKCCYVQTDTVKCTYTSSYILYICCIMSWGVTAAGLSCSCSQWPAFQGAVKALASRFPMKGQPQGKKLFVIKNRKITLVSDSCNKNCQLAITSHEVNLMCVWWQGLIAKTLLE